MWEGRKTYHQTCGEDAVSTKKNIVFHLVRFLSATKLTLVAVGLSKDKDYAML